MAFPSRPPRGWWQAQRESCPWWGAVPGVSAPVGQLPGQLSVTTYRVAPKWKRGGWTQPHQCLISGAGGSGVARIRAALGYGGHVCLLHPRFSCFLRVKVILGLGSHLLAPEADSTGLRGGKEGDGAQRRQTGGAKSLVPEEGWPQRPPRCPACARWHGPAWQWICLPLTRRGRWAAVGWWPPSGIGRYAERGAWVLFLELELDGGPGLCGARGSQRCRQEGAWSPQSPGAGAGADPGGKGGVGEGGETLGSRLPSPVQHHRPHRTRPEAHASSDDR